MRFQLSSLTLCAALLAGCGTPVQNPVTGRQARTEMDPAQEIALGRKEHQAVLQEMPAYAHARVQAYVIRGSPLPSAEQQLRLINGVHGGGDPQPGR